MSLIYKLELITQLFPFQPSSWTCPKVMNLIHTSGSQLSPLLWHLSSRIPYLLWCLFAILVKVISWNKNAITFLEVGWHYLGLVKARKFIYVWTEEFDRRSIDNVRLFSFDLLIAVIIRWYFDIYSCINFLSIHVWNQQYFHLSIYCAHYLFFPIVMRFFNKQFLSSSLNNFNFFDVSHVFIKWWFNNLLHKPVPYFIFVSFF